jgi:hypothetical protein
MGKSNKMEVKSSITHNTIMYCHGVTHPTFINLKKKYMKEDLNL